ncbi:MAG: hypothetical protein NWF04_07520 [Candidatus Bathyarchaeota archaeon]|nr:hypothetical protein [Candidatus Bathyarchaeota archaeon]
MKQKRLVALLLVAIIAGGLPLSILCCAAQVTKPSVPEFTLRFLDSPFDAPPVYGVDPETGQSVVLEEGYHVKKGIELTIKNHKYAPVDTAYGPTRLYYNFHVKDYHPQNNTKYEDWRVLYNPEDMLPPSDSENTTLLFYLVDKDRYYYDGYSPAQFIVPEGGQLDVQVQAYLGCVHRELNQNWTGESIFDLYPYVFSGETSGWSSTQTLKILQSLPSESSTATPTITTPSSPLGSSSPTSTPTLPSPEFPAWALITVILLLALAVLTGAIILRKNQSRY